MKERTKQRLQWTAVVGMVLIVVVSSIIGICTFVNKNDVSKQECNYILVTVKNKEEITGGCWLFGCQENQYMIYVNDETKMTTYSVCVSNTDYQNILIDDKMYYCTVHNTLRYL